MCRDLRSKMRCCLLRRTPTLSRLLAQIKSNDYLVVLFYARVIGRDWWGASFPVCALLYALLWFFAPTLLFRCSLCIHLFLIDKGQEVNALPALPRGSRPQTFFFLPPLIFLQATCMREQCTAGCIFLFLLLPVGIGTLRNSPRDISCDFRELSLTLWFPFSFTCEWGGAACLVIKRILDSSATRFFFIPRKNKL